MTAELGELLRGMDPELDPDEFAYCTIPGPAPRDLHPVCVFRESEGETLILRRSEAESQHMAYTFPCRKITLRVHSSLQAVGFLARVAAELAEHGISVNCVSAFYHDHLFVPASEAERALRLLRELQRRSTAGKNVSIPR